jgi:hypothetical protein
MKFQKFNILFRRIEPRKIVLAIAMIVYVLLSLVLFFVIVNPSLTGETRDHIAADSSRYMYFADSLREGDNDPLVLLAMSSFPNTLWFPVLIALLINSTFLTVVLNYAIFSYAVWLFTRAVKIRVGILLALLLANATTLISLLSVNKEMLDLLATALFCHWMSKGRKTTLVLALVIATINRFEVLVAMLLFIFLRSRWNLLRRHRLGSLVCVCIAISIFFPLLSLNSMVASRLDEAVSTAQSEGILISLDNLQLHYFFIIATIPKIADNLFSEIINVPRWSTYNVEDAANTYILFLNNLASLYVLLVLVRMRRLNLKREWLYFAAVTAIVMSISPVIQPRYFYSCYVLFCLEAARVKEPGEKFWQFAMGSQTQNVALKQQIVK